MNNNLEPEWKKDSNQVVLIDEDHLDKECIAMPAAYLSYAKLQADLNHEVAELKASLAVVEADVGRKIRQNPDVYGIEKITEASVSEALAIHKDCRVARSKYRKAQYDHELAQAVVNALEHKKRSLTLLVELHGLGYFASPRLSAKGHAAVTEKAQKSSRMKSLRAAKDLD